MSWEEPLASCTALPAERVVGSVGPYKVQGWEPEAPRKAELGLTAAFRHRKGPRGERTDGASLLHLHVQEMVQGNERKGKPKTGVRRNRTFLYGPQSSDLGIGWLLGGYAMFTSLKPSDTTSRLRWFRVRLKLLERRYQVAQFGVSVLA